MHHRAGAHTAHQWHLQLLCTRPRRCNGAHRAQGSSTQNTTTTQPRLLSGVCVHQLHPICASNLTQITLSVNTHSVTLSHTLATSHTHSYLPRGQVPASSCRAVHLVLLCLFNTQVAAQHRRQQDIRKEHNRKRLAGPRLPACGRLWLSLPSDNPCSITLAAPHNPCIKLSSDYLTPHSNSTHTWCRINMISSARASCGFGRYSVLPLLSSM